MDALDTNLLVYAHNTASPFHPQAKAFIETVMNERDAEGKLSVCIPGQVRSALLENQTIEEALADLHRYQASRTPRQQDLPH